MQHFVCIGHAKCGTTLLDSVFRQSRLMGTPETKEIKFFLPRFFPQEAAYGRYLEKFFTADGQRPALGTFEASPQYSHQPEETLRAVLENIKRTLPHPKVVICFRHPVLRAYSHYIHNLHTFALYGEGVFSPRPDLLRKPCRMSFEEALSGTSRLTVNYATTLRVAYDVMGRENVTLFFLENDGPNLEHWLYKNALAGVAEELREAARTAGAVFVRRPIPNYVRSGQFLHAFGSLPGEYVRYEDSDEGRLDAAMGDRDRWTLEVSESTSLQLARECFGVDIEACAAISDDERFQQYLSCIPERQFAELAAPELLSTLHQVSLEDRGHN